MGLIRAAVALLATSCLSCQPMCGTALLHAAEPSFYEKCVEIGAAGAKEAASLVLEWTLLPEHIHRVQFALHARSGRGYVGMGFHDTEGYQIIAGQPAVDTPCMQALYAGALERDGDGTPFPYDVEVPGQYAASDELWSHIRVDRNLSVSATADPYSGNLTFSLLWGYRNGGVVSGTCQDLAVADGTTEQLAFALDLADPGRLYGNPALRRKRFVAGERRCAALPEEALLGTPLHREGLLAGEMHQSMRNVVLLVGGNSGPAGGSLGLQSGEDPPAFDTQDGFVRAGEFGNDACQSGLHALHGTWSGFSDAVGGIARYSMTVVTREGDVLADEVGVALYTTYELPLQLQKNTTVQLTVAAYNHAGRRTMRRSNWVRVLNGGTPMQATVYNGPDDGGALSSFQGSAVPGSVAFWPSAGSFSAHWSGYLREDRDALNTTQGRDEWLERGYKYALGWQGHNDTAIIEWTATSSASFMAKGLGLQHGERYYVTVRTVNCASMPTLAASARFTVDLQPPNPGIVFDGNVTHYTDRSTMRPFDPLSASWAFFSDTTSGLHHYEWAAGTSRLNFTDPDILSWVNVGEAQAASTLSSAMNSTVPDMRTLGVSVGDTVYVYVRAYDKAGHHTTVSSNGTLVALY